MAKSSFQRTIDTILELKDPLDRAAEFCLQLIQLYEMDLHFAEISNPSELHEAELYKWNTFDFMRDCLSSGIFNNEVLDAVEKELATNQTEDYTRHRAYIISVYSFLNEIYE
jgi:hypothetical protein